MTEKSKIQFLTIQLSTELHNEIKSMCKELKLSMKEFAISAFDLEMRRFKKLKADCNPLNPDDFKLHLSKRQ